MTQLLRGRMKRKSLYYTIGGHVSYWAICGVTRNVSVSRLTVLALCPSTSANLGICSVLRVRRHLLCSSESSWPAGAAPFTLHTFATRHRCHYCTTITTALLLLFCITLILLHLLLLLFCTYCYSFTLTVTLLHLLLFFCTYCYSFALTVTLLHLLLHLFNWVLVHLLA